MRHISWFSCGAASAMATKLMLEKHPNTIVAYCHIENEHPDNLRFLRDCEKWFGRKVTILKSEKYSDCWELWEKRRYLNGPAGALCTTEMKKLVRRAFTLPDDIQAFGFTAEEGDRFTRFQENNPEVKAVAPLIGLNMGKGDCLDWLVSMEGITPPAMYAMGYHNANCVGCVKGGKGYWNKIRRDFPTTFKRMAELERSIGASCINGTYLDELNPRAGRHKDLELPECGLFCGESA